MKKIILASASPARADLMQIIVPQFEISISKVNEVDETSGLSYEAIAMLNAKLKATAVFKEYSATGSDCLVIGADTVVVSPAEDRLLHKPKDIAEAKAHLRTLAGSKHRVITGIFIIDKHKSVMEAVVSKVTLREITDDEINAYVTDGHTLNKSGGFSIAELLDLGFVTKIEGSVDNIIGLPTERLKTLIAQF